MCQWGQRHGVRVSAVAHGPIATERNEEFADHVTPVLARIPSRRLSAPAEVAAAVVFLASDDAANVDGTILSVDGGGRRLNTWPRFCFMTAYDVGLLILRLVLGLTMASHGYNKFFGGGRISGTAGWFESIGMKPGTFRARVARVAAKGGAASPDIWKSIFWLQQAPGAPSAEAAISQARQGYLFEIKSKHGQAAQLYDEVINASAPVGSHAAWRNPTADGERWRIRHRPWDTPSRNWGSW